MVLWPQIVLVRPETRGRGERGRVLCGERDLRAGQQEPQELSGHGAQVLPPAHHLVQQLDAHQGKPKSTEHMHASRHIIGEICADTTCELHHHSRVCQSCLALPQVVKLLGSLVPEEPRLARKLLEPLATIIQNTAAKSLLYECIHTVTLALPFARKADGTDSRNVQVRHPSPCNPSIAALFPPPHICPLHWCVAGGGESVQRAPASVRGG